MDNSNPSNESKALNLRQDKQPDGGAYRFRSMSAPLPSFESSKLDERHTLRSHSTPAASMPQRGNISDRYTSASIETTTTAPRRVSATCSHHVMQQWQQEDPKEEPFTSVVYYAKSMSNSKKTNPE